MLIRALAVIAALLAGACQAGPAPPWMGANVKVSPDAPWGSAEAAASLQDLAGAGASRALLVAFVWQASPRSDAPVLGSDSGPAQMRQALRQSRAAGLAPVLKVHLWIPGHWAGDAAPADRAAWFAAYQRALLRLAEVAQSEHAQALVIGTELRQLQDAPQWPALVAAVRAVYRGPLVYVADGLDRAEAFTHWSLFDAVGTSLYPRLSADAATRRREMDSAAARLRRLGARVGKPVWVAELGLRSAQGALAAPWESPEQRHAPVDLAVQAEVLQQWRQALQEHDVAGIGIWCWYTDPRAGGADDSDFTVQHKPARRVLAR
ncbi:MAG TPA: glycosidase-like protein [Xanthomonadaceae bacterium]|nr:glycosidase-like protein [Xanthomonadaceae bacterium]